MARTRPRRTYEISVYQNEREPLEDYRRGAVRDGVPCFIERFYTHGRLQYRATIRGVVNVARELSLTVKWIRTRKKRRQIEHLRRVLYERRKVVRKVIIDARRFAKSF
jgi:hypothetical protein